jgi:hypothetical protein
LRIFTLFIGLHRFFGEGCIRQCRLTNVLFSPCFKTLTIETYSYALNTVLLKWILHVILGEELILFLHRISRWHTYKIVGLAYRPHEQARGIYRNKPAKKLVNRRTRKTSLLISLLVRDYTTSHFGRTCLWKPGRSAAYMPNSWSSFHWRLHTEWCV